MLETSLLTIHILILEPPGPPDDGDVTKKAKEKLKDGKFDELSKDELKKLKPKDLIDISVS